MIVEFFRETGSFSYQSLQSGSEPGINAFYLLCVLFSNKMFIRWQHFFKRSPVIRAIRGILNGRKDKATEYILDNLYIKALKKAGFIENVSDFSHIEARIRQFFHLDNLFDYTNEVGGVLFSRTKNLSSEDAGNMGEGSHLSISKNGQPQ